MNWEVVAPKLLSMLQDIGSEGTGTLITSEHADRPLTMTPVSSATKLKMRLLSCIPIGRDSVVRTFDEDADPAQAQRVTMRGHRRLTVQVECDALHNTDRAWAWATISRIQNRIQRPRILNDLDRFGLALVRRGNTQERNFKLEGRIANRVLLELVFGVQIEDTDPQPENWIETVFLTTHAEDIDGTELPAAIQAVDLEI